MKRYGFVVLMGVGMAFSWAAMAQQNPMQAGNWEIRMEMDMPNAPIKLPPITQTQCITQEQIDDPAKALSGPQAESCEISDYTVDGNTMSWSMACSQPEQMTGTGQMTFTDANTYTGVVTLSTSAGNMTMKYAGKRLGACEK